MSNQVILVDENDNEIGIEEKISAHKKKLLHRAFSIFLFNKSSEILLQKRAPKKYHSGNLWTNTCCSHPIPNISLKQSAKKRLLEEMGIDTELIKVFSFIYETEFTNGLFEYEYGVLRTSILCCTAGACNTACKAACGAGPQHARTRNWVQHVPPQAD